MDTRMIIFLFGLVSQVVCNPDTHVYSDDCKPPTGYESNTTDVTTPDYVTMRPIERCCPQVDKCNHVGGTCLLKWARELYPQCCDFSPVEPCKDYSCECCVRCADDTCSPCVQTGGECRKDCRAGELEDNTNVCSYHNNGTGCKCCKTCEATSECTDALGSCRTNPNDCEHGTFPSTGCCGGCFCCKPVVHPFPGSTCKKNGGYCSETDDCATGYYACFGECAKTLYTAGLRSVVVGYCCVPKTTANQVNRIDQQQQQAFRMNQDTAPEHQDQQQHHQQHAPRRHPKQLAE